MVFEMLVFSPLNHLIWLIARENFIKLPLTFQNQNSNQQELNSPGIQRFCSTGEA